MSDLKLSWQAKIDGETVGAYVTLTDFAYNEALVKKVLELLASQAARTLNKQYTQGGNAKGMFDAGRFEISK